MAALNFPSSPSNNDTHTENNLTYKYDSTDGVWNLSSSASQTMVVGVRSGSAVTVSISGGSFTVTGRSSDVTVNV